MKTKIVMGAVALGLCTAGAAVADPAANLGLTFRFGANSAPALGVTAKVLSSDEEDKGVVGLGVSWYPGSSQPFGVDVSAGYNYDGTSALVGYDFLARGMALSVGVTNTDEKHHRRRPPVVSAATAQ